LKVEATRNGEDFDLNEPEARELFDLIRNEFSEIVDGESIDGDSSDELRDETPFANESSAVQRYENFLATLEREPKEADDDEFESSEAEIQNRFQSIPDDILDEAEIVSLATLDVKNQQGVGDFDGQISTQDLTASSCDPSNKVDETKQSSEPLQSNVAVNPKEDMSDLELAGELDLTNKGYDPPSTFEELQAALPGLPRGRLMKIVNAFEETLGYPSMLTLVPILRETMPNRVTLGWLRSANRRNADFILQKASEDGLVDSSLLNAMLEVRTSAGSIDDALDFHAADFHKHKLVSRIFCKRKDPTGNCFPLHTILIHSILLIAFNSLLRPSVIAWSFKCS
jgi:hypothetical protein